MQSYEYKVVPAPEKAPKVKGLKGPDLFAHAVEALMNDMAAEGWSYLRAETLPQEERAGLTSKTTTYRNLLVFQRPLATAEAAAELGAEPQDVPPMPPATEPIATPRPGPERADTDPSTENLWTDPAEDDAPDNPQPLFPNRQRQSVDL